MIMIPLGFIMIVLFIARLIYVKKSDAKLLKEHNRNERIKLNTIKLHKKVEEINEIINTPFYELDVVKIEKHIEEHFEKVIKVGIEKTPDEHKNNSRYHNKLLTACLDYSYNFSEKDFINRSAPNKGMTELQFFKMLNKIRDKMENKYLN